MFSESLFAKQCKGLINSANVEFGAVEKGAKVCTFCRFCKVLQNEYYLQKSASIQPRKGLDKFAV